MHYRTMMLALAGAATLLGQPSGPRQPATDAIKTYLGLTDAEVQALTQIGQQSSQAVQTARQKMRQDQTTLQTMLQSGSADAATLGNLLLDIQTQQASISKQRSTFSAQAANVLTADQKTKLQALAAAQQLQPAISQATGLLLLAPPQNAPTVMPSFGPSFYRHRGPRPTPDN